VLLLDQLSWYYDFEHVVDVILWSLLRWIKAMIYKFLFG